MKLNLRLFLTVAFTLIATVPVVYLALWVERTAYEKEIDSVREKHLLLARNITAALERYVDDVESTLSYILTVGGDRSAPMPAAAQMLADQFGIRSIDVVDSRRDFARLARLIGPEPESRALPSGLVEFLKSHGIGANRYSHVILDRRGRPTIYICRMLTDNRVAAAAIGTEYIVQLQKAISFGRKGHAAIVDQTGRVIAHPRESWQREVKSIAGVLPVQKMIAGESGVAEFYSPAIEKNMISGYTVVRGPGWGVMVPQPIDELEERASDVFRIALAVGLAGMISAIVLGWLLTGILVSPLQKFIAVTRRVRDGDLEARVGDHSVLAPEEFRELGRAFDRMAIQLQNDQRMMEEALDEVREADRAKSEFLANMSHELRTPLNAIIGFSSMIGGTRVAPHQIREYAADIHDSGKHLLSVINDILDISSIETGEVEFREEETSLQRVVEASLKLVQPQAAAANVRIERVIDRDVPSVSVDETRQRQILVNLLSNAIKFTPDNGTVEIRLSRDPDGTVSITVKDTGIGMTDDEIAVALTPFGQVDGSATRKYDGTGLGLPLTKRFVELQGGRFHIESEPDGGTTVRIEYPVEKVCPKAA